MIVPFNITKHLAGKCKDGSCEYKSNRGQRGKEKKKKSPHGGRGRLLPLLGALYMGKRRAGDSIALGGGGGKKKEKICSIGCGHLTERNGYACTCNQSYCGFAAGKNPLLHFPRSALRLEISPIVILVQIRLSPTRCLIQGYNCPGSPLPSLAAARHLDSPTPVRFAGEV